MGTTMITRRGLLASAAAGALTGLGGALRPSTVIAQEAPSTTLIAGKRSIEVNGRAASVFGITQPDGRQGLLTEVGAPFRVVLRNETGSDTLIHWHGLTPPSSQDGVPGISAPPVPPGGSARYDFTLAFPGTFFMHSHLGLQEQSLMSAPLIVRDKGGVGDRQEVVLMLHDFAFRPPEEIYADLRRVTASPAGDEMDRMAGMDDMVKSHSGQGLHGMAGMSSHQANDVGAAGMAMDLNDVVFDAFLANDRTLADPQVVKVEPNGRVLLRVINAAAASNFLIDLSPLRAALVAVDGHPVQPVTGSSFPVAIAQRLDLTFQLPPGKTTLPVFASLEGERKRTGIVLATPGARVSKFTARAAKEVPPLNFRVELGLRAQAPLALRPAGRTHHVDLTGTMAGYVWTLNDATFGRDRPLMVSKGQRVEIVMRNRTMMSHPMHLHGHVFQVVAVDGHRFGGAVRDTVLVPPMTAVTIAFDADNPGHWAFHCHNLYHMAAGMMTTVLYEAN